MIGIPPLLHDGLIDCLLVSYPLDLRVFLAVQSREKVNDRLTFQCFLFDPVELIQDF